MAKPPEITHPYGCDGGTLAVTYDKAKAGIFKSPDFAARKIFRGRNKKARRDCAGLFVSS